MNRKLSFLALLIFVIGLLAFYAGTGITAASEPQKNSGDSVQELKTRVANWRFRLLPCKRKSKSFPRRPLPEF